MATVSDILALALKDVGVIGEGDTASAETLQDAFTTLKQMLAMWQIDRLYVYAQKETVVTLTGAQSYAVGPGGDVAMARPNRIDAAYWRDGSIDTPLEVLDSLDKYSSIADKTIAGVPALVCYVPSYPLGTLYVWPQPSGGTIRIVTSVDLPTYTTVGNDLSIPPQYEMLVRYSLAETLSSVFQLPPRPDIRDMAQRMRRMVKRNNVVVPELELPSAVMRNRYFNVNEG